MPEFLPVTQYPVHPLAAVAGYANDVEEKDYKRRQRRNEQLASVLGLTGDRQRIAGETARQAFEALTRPYEFEQKKAEAARSATMAETARQSQPYDVGLKEKPADVQRAKREAIDNFLSGKPGMLNPTLGFTPEQVNTLTSLRERYGNRVDVNLTQTVDIGSSLARMQTRLAGAYDVTPSVIEGTIEKPNDSEGLW